MFVCFYLMITSFASLLVDSEGETTCDCSKLGDIEVMVQLILYENRLMSTKLRRLEGRQSTPLHSQTTPNSDDRLEKLEQKVEALEIKFNGTITIAKENQEVFGGGIGAIVKKTLNSEKMERTKFALSVNKRIDEHKESHEKLKVALNNAIDERFEHITVIQNKHSNEVLNNISKFQEDTIVDVNTRLSIIEQVNKSIQFVATDLNAVNQSVSETRDMIEALGKSVEGDKVRLVNGSNRYEGRLEVFHKGSWGTVCDDDFDRNAASVVCKMLYPHSDVISVHSEAHFGQGSSPILLDDVRCKGTETSIFSCSHDFWGKHNCKHNEDVGISCTSARLVNGSNRYEGRLEVFHNGAWGTVCDDDFDRNAARVVCKMLNFPSDVISVHMNAHFGKGSLPVLLDDVKCNGTESSIFSCSNNLLGKHNCGHHKDVGISCNSVVRLVNGSNQYQGRLEVFHTGAWGTVCDDGFDVKAAHVVCKMLQFQSDVISVHGSAHFGQGSLPIFLDDVKCKGYETSIFSCSHKPLSTHNCGHGEDVGLSCTKA